MNVSLIPLENRDLDTIFQHVTDPESIRMAAFTAEKQTDRPAFLDKMSRIRADTSTTNRVIEVDGAIAGTIASFRIDDQLEVTYWIERTHWGKGIASAALQMLLAETAERPVYARPRHAVQVAPGRRRGSARWARFRAGPLDRASARQSHRIAEATASPRFC